MKSLLLAADDMTKDIVFSVHSVKTGGDIYKGYQGQALKMGAIALPYFTATLYGNTDDVVIFDIRLVNLMLVSGDFAESQRSKKMVPPTLKRISRKKTQPKKKLS